MRPVYIESASLLLQEVNESSGELKKELEVTSGQKFRRVNHFVLLALAGVFRLPDLVKTDPLCSLYVGTMNGCVRDVVTMLEQMYRDTLLPLPFTFMGTSTNMAGFHIAKTLGLSGSNSTVSNPYGAFEYALSLAYNDIKREKTAFALVGCVDEGVLPLEEFKRVTHNSVNTPLLEGGCWLKLSHECENPLGVIVACESFKTHEEIHAYLECHDFSDSIMVISAKESPYIGSSSSIEYARVLQEQRSGVVALIAQEGVTRFSVILTRLLG
jgi:hypothetical protein